MHDKYENSFHKTYSKNDLYQEFHQLTLDCLEELTNEKKNKKTNE